MFVCCEYCVLSGRGLCNELITRPEESYRLWCFVMCDLEKPQERGHDQRWVAAPQTKKLSLKTTVYCQLWLLQRHVSTQPSHHQAILEPYLRCTKKQCTFGIPHVHCYFDTP